MKSSKELISSSFNARIYREFFNTSKAAWKTIEKVRSCAGESIEKHGDPYTERPDLNFIFFDIHSLMAICYDYAFSAWENYLQHIGFILFDDWDSKNPNKQRTYKQKYARLLDFDDMLADKKFPHIDYQKLGRDWKKIIESINPNIDLPAKKRNPLKHIHSEVHEVKILYSDGISSSSENYQELMKETYFSLTDENCINFLNKLENLINATHEFLKQNAIIFKIHLHDDTGELMQKRKRLWQTFLISPWSTTLFSENRGFKHPA